MLLGVGAACLELLILTPLTIHGGFPKMGGYLFGKSHDKDYGVLGSVGVLLFWELGFQACGVQGLRFRLHWA